MINGYSLMRSWFDFAFEHQGIVSGNHTGMFCWFIEQNNRMGWAKHFAAPRDQTMAAVGISSYNTYKKVFSDLTEWGFVKIVRRSENQYSANVIALSKNDKSVDKSLDKAVTYHLTNHCSGTVTGTVTINKLLNKETKKPINPSPSLIATGDEKYFYNSAKEIFLDLYKEKNNAGDYYFKSLDGKKLKSILKQLFFKCKEKNKKASFSEAEMVGATTLFFTQAYETGSDWLKSNFSLSNIDSQFNNIYTAIHNGHSKTSKSKPAAATAEGVIGKLNEKLGGIKP